MASSSTSPGSPEPEYSFTHSDVYQTFKKEVEKLLQHRNIRCGIDLKDIMTNCQDLCEMFDKSRLDLNIDQFRQYLIREGCQMDMFTQFTQFWNDLLVICSYSMSLMHLLPVGVIINTVVNTLNIPKSVELCPDYPTCPAVTIRAYHAEDTKKRYPTISDEEIKISFDSLNRVELRDFYNIWSKELMEYVIKLNNLGLSQPGMIEHHKLYAEEARAKAEAAYSKLQAKVHAMDKEINSEATEEERDYLRFRQRMSSQFGNMPSNEVEIQCRDLYQKTDKRVIAALFKE